MIRPGILPILFCALCLAPSLAHARPRVEFDRSGVPLTAPEYAVDRVAHSYETEAIARIRKLLKASRTRDQQGKLLMRLAQIQIKRADIMFRIAHGDAYRAKKPINLVAYKRSLLETIGTLNQLISGFPERAETPHAYMMRAKAYQELGDRV